MNNKDIRWKQRFENFEKAFIQLKDAVSRYESLDDLSKEGLIHRFEYTFELAWKTLNDYLESNGVISKFPREVLKNAFQAELINNGEIWIDMLEKRNLLAHTYDKKNFNDALQIILKLYYPEMLNLFLFLKSEQ
ncbi:MAG: nucleotidyltransferase [Bacteroidales bacterium]|nr:nucleotidyltransferase [Bacteroidales bacterium]